MTRLTQHSCMTAVQCGSPRNLCPSAWSLLAVNSLPDSPRSPQFPFKSLSPKLPVFIITLIYSPVKQIRTWISPPSLPPKFRLSKGRLLFLYRTWIQLISPTGRLTPASNPKTYFWPLQTPACMCLMYAHSCRLTHIHTNINLFLKKSNLLK